MSMYDKNHYNIVNISLQLIKINEKKFFKKRFTSKKSLKKKKWGGDFPGTLLVKTLPSSAGNGV